MIQTDWNNFTPRMGFAYRVTNNMVIRAGYGLFVAGTILNPFRNNLGNIFPYTIQTNYAARNATPNRPPEVLLSDPLGTLGRDLIIGGGWLGNRPSASGITQNPKQAYLQSWNFTIERQLPGGTSIEMDYRGSKGTFLIRRYDHNQAIRTRDWFLANRTATGGFTENFQSLRPNPDWNAINFYNTGSNSNYHAANVSWRKRSRRGLFWRVNYSFSKSIDDASRTNGSGPTDFANALDRRNLRLERGRSTWDRRHVFTLVGNYNLPFGRGRRWGRQWAPATQAVLGGWQLSGTQTSYSGSPFTVMAANADQNLGESLRPHRVSHGAQADDPSLGAIRGVDYPFFDTSAFVSVPSCVDADQEGRHAGVLPRWSLRTGLGGPQHSGRPGPLQRQRGTVQELPGSRGHAPAVADRVVQLPEPDQLHHDQRIPAVQRSWRRFLHPHREHRSRRRPENLPVRGQAAVLSLHSGRSGIGVPGVTKCRDGGGIPSLPPDSWRSASTIRQCPWSVPSVVPEFLRSAEVKLAICRLRSGAATKNQG